MRKDSTIKLKRKVRKAPVKVTRKKEDSLNKLIINLGGRVDIGLDKIEKAIQVRQSVEELTRTENIKIWSENKKLKSENLLLLKKSQNLEKTYEDIKSGIAMIFDVKYPGRMITMSTYFGNTNSSILTTSSDTEYTVAQSEEINILNSILEKLGVK